MTSLATASCKDLISQNEKTFITDGIVSFGYRSDGRRVDQIRKKIFIESPVAQAMGSSRVIISESSHPTDVLVAIKGDIVQDPALSGIKVSVESAGTNRIGSIEDRNAILGLWFKSFISESQCFGPEFFVIQEDKHFWNLSVEVLVISDLAGGLFDCMGIAIREALKSCRLPHVQIEVSGESESVNISDDPSLSKSIEISDLPICTEIGLISPQLFLVDTNLSEENCCICKFWTAIDASGKVYAVDSIGSDALVDSQTVFQVLSTALSLSDNK
jgi:exosome complex RNA-binding protein Rrp42 (RNase PH superfamily)